MHPRPLGASWVPWCLLGASWVPVGVLSGCLLGASWVLPGCFLGASWCLGALVPPGCLLVVSWVPPWCFLGASWVPPACLLGVSSLLFSSLLFSSLLFSSLLPIIPQVGSKNLFGVSCWGNFLLVFIENGGFGESPLRTSVASFPAGGFFFCLMSLLLKNMFFADCSMIFLQNDYNVSSNQGTTYKTGILDPIEFWWVP